MASGGLNTPLRLVYCTSGGLYGALVLQRLLRSPDVEVVAVVLSTRLLRKHYAWWRGAWEQIRLTGLPYALYLWCATTIADLLGRVSRVPPLRWQTRQHALPLLATVDVNAPDGLAFVAAASPDVLLAGFFNQRLGEAVCALPRHGAVNIHPGELPELRGVDPVFAALTQARERLVVTVHRVTSEFDAGPVLADSGVEVAAGASLLRATAQLFCRGAELFLETVGRIRVGDAGVPQRGAGGCAPWPAPTAVARFRHRGGALVRWTDISALLRGDLCLEAP
jgi:methionyl-tRNA formyltransferase